MAGDSRSFDSPDETRTFEHGKVDVLKVGDTTLMKFYFEPGWKWSESVKPKVGTDTCQKRHVGYVESGQLKVVSDDGAKTDLNAGDAYVIEPGHDAWVEGTDPWVGLEFEAETAETYAKE
jgi:uncharacterized cupin superfamily protein